MDTPRDSAMHRFVRRVVLAASLLFLACGEDGDHYAPLGNDETPRETVVAGLVRDAGKSAVSDALVVIEPATNGVPASADFLAKNPGAASASTPGRRVTTTNDHGRFAFDDVEAGDYYLQVIADDHLGGMQSVRVPDRMALVDTVYVDVNLTPTGTFSGVATLENAASHQGTVVYVEGTSYVAITDPTGAYAITNVPVGSYTIRAEHAHYLEDTENGTLTTAGENVALASMLLKLNSNISPVATIASASPLYATFPVDFVASGSDADGSVVLYEWDWEDDGTFDYSSPSTASTSHTYAATGDYTAKLRVTDDGGAIGLAAIQLTITTLPVAVYMATTGNDANDGSVASPVLTLVRAYQVAQAENLDEIFIAQGTYFQVPAFLPGYTIRGGRSLPLWEESASAYSRFSYAASRATASTINTSTLIRRVELVLSAPGGPGQNSIALYASNSNSTLVFEECRFQTNNGLAGTSGLPGSVGQSGGNGSAGNPGSCDGARGLGGAGGFSPVACTGGGGGAGGVEGPNNGQTGGAGGCGGGGGGTGGQGDEGSVLSCDAVGGPGAQGSSGSAGSGGPNGSPASNTGTIAGNEWVPNTSSAGGPGGSGRGGGGGGGGGGQGGTFCDDGGGNGGGGGGGGGEGGDGGGGGQGGRASFCVMLVNSSPTFVDCMFQRAVGGAGGSGAAGRPGGSGGSGGSGATACTGEVGRGGNGGAGGAGGTGGGGAGGPGGPSFGIYRVNSFPSVVNPTYSGGAGGTGGLGGGTAFDGPAGLSGNIN